MSWDVEYIAPRLRVISDNDYAGDPDGLVQLAHLLLSATVEVPFVIGSHLPRDTFNTDGRSAARAVVEARRVAALSRRAELKIIAGSESALGSRTEPIATDAAQAIVGEALRDDTDLPLYITCGGGLTEIASAWLLEPRIAQRVTVVWIGGHEYDGIAPPAWRGRSRIQHVDRPDRRTSGLQRLRSVLVADPAQRVSNGDDLARGAGAADGDDRPRPASVRAPRQCRRSAEVVRAQPRRDLRARR